MILGVTGHRPQNLYGFNPFEPGNLFVIQQIGKALKKLQPEKVISGMALGTDQFVTEVCLQLKLPFIAAIPFVGQESKWPEKAQKRYQKLLELAVEVKVVCGEGYTVEKLQTRNEWIVDNSDMMLGIYGGSPGGTRNCLEYAKAQNKKIQIINPGNYYSTEIDD